MNAPQTPDGVSDTLATIEAFNHGLGTGGIKAERSVIDAAKRIVTDVPDDWRLPQLSLSDDGEIGLVWYGPGGKITALLHPTHGVAWLVRETGGRRAAFADPLGAPIPESVALSMATIYPPEPRA